MIWLSPNEGHLRQTNVTIRLLRIKLCRVYPDIRFEMVAASDSCNQSVCMLQKHVFCREKVKGWNEQECTKSHEELPKMHKIIWGNSKNAQNPTRNFQKCTTLYEKHTTMHKIPRGTSKIYTIPWRTLKYAQSYEELLKMHKIPGFWSGPVLLNKLFCVVFCSCLCLWIVCLIEPSVFL